MPLQPTDARTDVLLVSHATGELEESGLIDLTAQFGDLVGGARVVLLYRGSEWHAVRVEKEQGGHHAAYPYTCDVPAADPGLLEDRADGGRRVVPPALRLFLGPPWVGEWR